MVIPFRHNMVGEGLHQIPNAWNLYLTNFNSKNSKTNNYVSSNIIEAVVTLACCNL